MKCPYCNEEIEDNSKECKYCGEKITFVNRAVINIKNVFVNNKKNIAIILAIFGICVAIIFAGVNIYKVVQNNMKSPYYKSVEEHEIIEESDSPVDAEYILTKINNQEKDLLELLESKAWQTRKDNVFLTYLKNLKYYNEVLQNNSFGIWDFPENSNTYYIDGITYEKINLGSTTDEYGYTYENTKYSILNANAKMFKCTNYGEGIIGVSINMKYLNDKFSKYLSDDIKDYLRIRTLEDEKLGEFAFYNDGALSLNPIDTIDWIIDWQKYLEKYPTSPLKDEVSKSLDMYCGHILYSMYYSMDYSTDKITKEALKTFDEFFKRVDKSTREYKLVQEKYNVLKDEYNFNIGRAIQADSTLLAMPKSNDDTPFYVGGTLY